MYWYGGSQFNHIVNSVINTRYNTGSYSVQLIPVKKATSYKLVSTSYPGFVFGYPGFVFLINDMSTSNLVPFSDAFNTLTSLLQEIQ